MDFLQIIPTAEWVGYIASFFVLVSFLMKDIRTLRLINTVGCSAFIVYGILLNWSIPIIVTNAAIAVINSISLLKSNKDKATTN